LSDPKRSTDEWEDVETRANQIAADLLAEEVLEGFRKLAQQRSDQKEPPQGA
jgi:hypothetical protein